MFFKLCSRRNKDISKQLMSSLLSDSKKEDPYKFYLKNQEKPIDIYYKEKYQGYEYTLIRMCAIRGGADLLRVILNSSYAQNKFIHNWVEVFDLLVSFSYNKEIFFILSQYYLHKLPKNENKDPQLFLENLQQPEDPKNMFHKHFDTFPLQELWRLFIDSNKQIKEKAWLDFECREQGYIFGMLNGFNFLKSTIDLSLSSELLKQFHKECSNEVKNLDESHKAGCFRNETKISFGLVYKDNASILGFIELIENQKNNPASYRAESYVRLNALPEKEIEIEVNEIIKAYHQKIKESHDHDKRLWAIIDLISNLERAHPFGDANCRTICILILNRELIRNNFSPVILEDPNRFDGLSRCELYNEIITGMKQFQEVKKGNTLNLGINTNDILNIINTDPSYHKLKDTAQRLNEKIMEFSCIFSPVIKCFAA